MVEPSCPAIPSKARRGWAARRPNSSPRKSATEQTAKHEAERRAKEEAKLRLQKAEAEKKKKTRDLERAKEHAEALAKAAKEVEDRKAHEKARLKAEAELRAAEQKHALELKKHRDLAGKKELQRNQDAAKAKALEDERVRVEAAKQAKLIYEAKIKEEKERIARVEAKTKVDKATLASDEARNAKETLSGSLFTVIGIVKYLSIGLILLGLLLVGTAVSLGGEGVEVDFRNEFARIGAKFVEDALATIISLPATLSALVLSAINS